MKIFKFLLVTVTNFLFFFSQSALAVYGTDDVPDNKGEKTVYCLRSRDDKNKIVELNTMMFVALHELAHTMTKSIGHTKEFWDNMRFILEQGERIGVYRPIDYSKNHEEYCGMTINSTPYNFN